MGNGSEVGPVPGEQGLVGSPPTNQLARPALQPADRAVLSGLSRLPSAQYLVAGNTGCPKWFGTEIRDPPVMSLSCGFCSLMINSPAAGSFG